MLFVDKFIQHKSRLSVLGDDSFMWKSQALRTRLKQPLAEALTCRSLALPSLMGPHLEHSVDPVNHVCCLFAFYSFFLITCKPAVYRC